MRFAPSHLLAGLLSALLFLPHSGHAAPYKAGPGPHEVEVVDDRWMDGNRGGREVPWRAYLPEDLSTPAPVVIWSHGGGGSREGAAYLGQHLASHGYAAFHIQHKGSDTEALRTDPTQIRAAVMSPEGGADRYRDVQFAVDSLVAMARQGSYAGRLDGSRIGMSGHSFGAITTLIAAGQRLPGFEQDLAEPRFLAAYALSPSPPRPGYRHPDPYSAMLMPIFHLTGTKDDSPMGDFDPIDRQRPFEETDNVDQYLLVLNDATHFTPSGRLQRGGEDLSYPGIERHHDLILMSATAFWDWHLKGEEAARAWLEGGGLVEELGEDGTFIFKPAAQ